MKRASVSIVASSVLRRLAKTLALAAVVCMGSAIDIPMCMEHWLRAGGVSAIARIS